MAGGSASLGASSLGVEHGTSIRGPLKTRKKKGGRALRATTAKQQEPFRRAMQDVHDERRRDWPRLFAGTLRFASASGISPSGSPCTFVYRLRRNRS